MAEILGGTLITIALLAFLFGCVNIIYPIKALRIPTRRRAALILLASLAGFVAGGSLVETPAQSDDSLGDATESAPPADRKVLATWEIESWAGQWVARTLVHQEGAIIRESRNLPDGKATPQVLIERPWANPSERRFDLQPDWERPEYITLSNTGVIRKFSWDGREFDTAKATFIDPDAMTIGANPVIKECVPKQLSESAMQIVGLYEQLHGFIDEPLFAQVGFSPQGPYNDWLATVREIAHSGGGLELSEEIGFAAGEVMNLGLNYMSLATGQSVDDQHVLRWERTISAGLKLAACIN